MQKSLGLTNIYYIIKPLLPRKFQIWLRRKIAQTKIQKYSNVWPILEKAGTPAKSWRGWPEGKKFALVLTHDVETAKGQQKCISLAELEKRLGFRSLFNFVPERYSVSENIRDYLVADNFEIGVHGLKHDGKLFRNKEIFKIRASRINRYLRDWNAEGFRSPAMHHNLEWLHELNIRYDLSTFDTDPFEPQSDGIESIFPFWVNGRIYPDGYAELPYTLPQDYTLFIIMKKSDIDIWKLKLDWVVKKGGMALLNVHPDYMRFGGGNLKTEEYPATYYEKFLEYVKRKYQGEYWHALPSDIARFVKLNLVGEVVETNQLCLHKRLIKS